MIMRLLTLYIILDLVQSQCTMYMNNFEMYATQNESEEWNVRNSLIDGWNLNYVIEEDKESNFNLITNFQVLNAQNHKKQKTFITRMKALRMVNSSVWKSQLAFLDSNILGVDLYLSENIEKPNFDTIYHVMDENFKCLDLDFIDENTLIIGCLSVDQQVTLYLIDMQGLILDQLPIDLKYQLDGQLIINSYYYHSNQFIMVTVPNYPDSQIIALQIMSNKIQQINQILDKQQLSKLLDQRDLDFQLMDFQILYENIYLLDCNLGVIQIIFDGQWKQAKLEYYPVSSNQKYMAFYINRQSYADIFGTQISILTQNNQNKYTFQTFNGIYCLLQKQFDNVFNINNIQLYHFERDYVIFDNPILYLVSGGLQYELKESSNILGYLYSDKILVNSKTSIQLINVGATLYFNAKLSSKLMETQTVRLSAYKDKQRSCNVTITYIIYKYNDGKLYKRLKSGQQNGVVYYPNYPVASLEQIELPQGPNIKGKFQLKYDSNLKIESKYFDLISFEGIGQEDAIFNNVMSGNSDNFIYFINQMGKIYDCKMKHNYYNFICTYKLTIPHYNPYNNNVVFQQSNDQILIIFAIMSLDNHQIDFYDIKSNGESNLFMTITTKLTDENSVIKSFIIVEDYIIIAQPLKKQIQIYSITTSLVLLTINQDWTPTKIFSKHKEIVFVCNQNYVHILYIDTSYTQINLLKISDDINIEIEIVILRERFIIIYKGDNSQGIFEYSIADLTNIYLLKNIPLYFYLLQSPLCVKVKDITGIYFVRAYDPINQQTVILYYHIQFSSMSRQYLFSSIPIGNYIPNGNNLRLYVSGNINIYLFIITDTIMLKLFVNNNFQAFLSPKISADQTYIMDTEIESTFWNSHYPITLNYNQPTKFVNLQSTILSDYNRFNSSELNLTKIPQTFILDIKDDWFFGQILSYNLDCLQCGINQESPIYLQNKIMPIKSNKFEGEIIVDVIEYDSQLIILTLNNLYLLSSDTQLILNNIPLKKHYEITPIKLFVKESNKLIIIINIRSIEVYGTTLNYFTLLAEVQFQDISEITDLIIIKDYIIIIDNSFNIRFYQFHQTQGQIIIDDCNLLIDYQIFQPRYLSFKQIQYKQKEINEYQLFISEITFGMVSLNIQYETNNVFTLKKWELLRINDKIIELGIQTRSYNIFQNLVFFNQGLLPKNIFKFIITNIYDASYIISIEFQELKTDIQILRVINGYGTLNRRQRISLKNNLLALSYYQFSQSDQVIVIYNVNEFNQDNLKENPIIALAGVQIQQSQYNPIYIIQHTDDNYNLIHVSLSDQIIQSQIKINAAIVIRDALEFQEEQPITLIARNTFTQSQYEFKINVITDDIQSSTYNLLSYYIRNLWIWLIIIMAIIIIISILIFLVVKIRRKINKKKQKENAVILLN